MNVLSVKEGSLSSVSSISSFSSFALILLWKFSDLLSSVEISLMMTLFDSLSSVEQNYDKFSSAMITFDSLSSKT